MSISRAVKMGGIVGFLSIIVLVACNILVIKGTNDLQNFAQRRLDSLLLAQEVRATSSSLTANARAYVSSANPDYEKAYWDLVHIRAGDMVRPSNAAVAPGVAIPLNDLLIAAGFTDEELALLQESNRISASLVLLEERAMNAVKGLYQDDSAKYTRQGEPDPDLARQLMFGKDYDAVVAQIMVPSYEFDKKVTERIAVQDKRVRDSLKLATTSLSVSVVVISLIVLAGVVLLLGKIVRPIRDTAAFAQSVAQGNLDAPVPHAGGSEKNNEITRMIGSMEQMVRNLKERIEDASHKSEEAAEQSRAAQAASLQATKARERAEAGQRAILAAAEEVETVVARLSTATEQLSAQIEESSRSAEHQQAMVAGAVEAVDAMNEAVHEVARNAELAAESSTHSRVRAEEGADVVRSSSASLDMVSTDAAKLAELMTRLGEQARAIDSIITVINDIADQTNLLALNAAIEAARAGEAGRGFAVVADSVRQLAEKTMVATKEVNETVSGIQQGTVQSLSAMEKTSENVKTAAQYAEQSGEALVGIVAGVQETADQMSHINDAAVRQTETCSSLTRALGEIDIVARETARVMMDSAGAVSELAGQTVQLQALVGQLRNSGSGDEDPPPSVEA